MHCDVCAISDFGGHDQHHFRNIYAYVGGCFGAPMPFRYFHGLNDAFLNNSCITLGAGYGVGPYSSDCDLDKSWQVSYNRVFTNTGEAQICGKDSWAEWFNASTYTGRDVGSTLAKWPTDEALVGWAEALLDFKGAA